MRRVSRRRGTSSRSSRGPRRQAKEVIERRLPREVEYSALRFIERLGKGEFGEVFRGYYHNEEADKKRSSGGASGGHQAVILR